MESAKKIIPFILVAVIFAVGGYFVGHSTLKDQGASLYSTKDLATRKMCVDVQGNTFPCDRGTVSADPSLIKATGGNTGGPVLTKTTGSHPKPNGY